MIKKLMAAMLALFAAVAFAAVDVNKASPAELDGVKGIGPAIAGKILDERKKAPFKDWNDLITRVKGVGEGNAAKFSAEGLTVNGTAYAGAPPAAKKDDKPAKAAAKAETAASAAKPADAKPADAKADAKKDAADKKAAAKKAKEEKAAAAKAEQEAKKAEKAAKAASAADAKKAAAAKASDAKASDAKPAKK